MKRALKIFLWLLAVLGALALCAVAATAYFFYHILDKNMFNYTCQSYIQLIDLPTALSKEEPDFNTDLNAKATGMYMVYFAITRHPGEKVADFATEENMVQAVNEFTSLCRAKPQLKINEIIDLKSSGEDKAREVAANEHLKSLLSDVSVTTDVTSTLYARAIYMYYQNEKKLGALISSSTTPVSATEVTPTIPEWLSITPTVPAAK